MCEIDKFKKIEKKQELIQIKAKLKEIINKFEQPYLDLYTKYLRSYLLVNRRYFYSQIYSFCL
jgi:hypothetical protein